MFALRLTLLGLCAMVALGSTPGVARAQDRHSPYADQTNREIKALAPGEIAGLLEGAGLGFAKAAELNGVPGPRHVLDLATELALSDEQRSRVQVVYDRMHERAVDLGRMIVELERELDQAFANPELATGDVERLTSEIGYARGQLRATHLVAHLETAKLLSSEQIARYGHLRGYSGHLEHDEGHPPEEVPR